MALGKKRKFGVTKGLAGSGAFSSPSGDVGLAFYAPLLTSLVPARATGGATFTRATTATVEDWEARIRNVLSGEIRFKGARRVRNYVVATENLVAGSWTPTNITVGTGVADPLGGTTAFTLTATAPTGQFEQALSAGAGGQSVVNSAYLRRRTGTGTILLGMANGSTTVDVTSVLTTQWKRLSGLLVGTSASYFWLQIITSGDAIDIWHPQAEEVTGQSNQNPGEYVSNTALATPYHGAGVDGVKYFATQNGNTVASNVVTEAAGAAIASTTLLGYLSEQASTNLCLQSENFGTTWAAVGTPTRVATNERCGSVVLDLIGDDDAGVLEGYTQTVTFTGDAVKAVSVFVKAGTSTSTVVRLRDTSAPADRLLVALAWSGGVPAPTATTGTVLGTDALGNGVYRIRMATTSVTAANTNSLQVYPATDSALLTTTTGNVNVGGVQAENNLFCTSYIPTTTATVTRNADALTYPSTGNLGVNNTIYAEVSGVLNTAIQPQVLALYTDGNNRSGPYLDTNGFVNAYVLATAVNTAHVIGTSDFRNTTKKFAQVYATDNVRQYIGGAGEGTPDTSAAMPAYTAIAIGAYLSGGFELNGCIRNVKAWIRPRSVNDLVGITT